MLYDLVYPFIWMDPVEWIQQPEVTSLPPTFRNLLISGDSTTSAIQSMGEVRLEMVRQEEGKLEPLWADFLDLPALQPVITRNVWLTTGGRRAMFAASVIPLEGLNLKLKRTLVQGTKPLGLAIDGESYRPEKDRIGISRILVTADTESTGIPIGRPMWARRYRLQVPRRLTAAITEIIHPDFFSS